MRKFLLTAVFLLLILFSSNNKFIEEPIVIKTKDVEFSLIRPVLLRLNEVLPGAYSENAIQLMLGTMAQESDFGYYLVQNQANPIIGAKGVFQVESLTNISKWNNFLRYNPRVAKFVRGIAAQHAFDSIFDGDELSEDFRHSRIHLENSEEIDNQLITNMAYNLVMARLKYWTVKGSIPSTLEGQANYWDVHFNANPDVGTESEYIESYYEFVKR